MPKKKTNDIQAQYSELKSLIEIMNSRDSAPYTFPRKRDGVVAKSEALALASRRGSDDDEDYFLTSYEAHPDIIRPIFPFEWLTKTYSECDTLGICVRSKVVNCANEKDYQYLGLDADKEKDEIQAQYIFMRDFLSQVNEGESWLQIERKVREDVEVTNNGFLEVLRDNSLEKDPTTGKYTVKGKIDRLYHIHATYMRVTKLDDYETPVDVVLPRAGQLRPVTIRKRFRRFARINPLTMAITWFKELGDPRILDANTGKYVTKTNAEATEIWWFRENQIGQVYGTVKWLSVIWDISGRYQAKWVNFDHLDNGAIAPWLALIKGGELTPGSRLTLDTIMTETRATEYYNRAYVLEVQPKVYPSMTGNSSVTEPKLDIVKLRDPHHEDFMFGKYLDSTEEAIRRVFRLPPVLTGLAGNDTFASAYTSMEVAESQVFEPSRAWLDEKLTTELIRNEFKIYLWKVRTRASKIGDKETFYRAVGALQRAGALTINDVRELSNQLLGTSFSPFEGALYNQPVTVVNTLAGNGQVTFDAGANSLVFQQIGEALASVDTTLKAAKNDADITRAAEDTAKKLIESMSEIQRLQYEPPEPEIDESDLNL